MTNAQGEKGVFIPVTRILANLLEQNKAFTQEKSLTLEHQHGCSFTKWPPQRQVKTVYCGRCGNSEFEVDYVGEACSTKDKMPQLILMIMPCSQGT